MSAKNEHGLTSQQELFAQQWGAGKSQSEAYRQAYPASRKWKPEIVHQKASALAANGKVRARVTLIQRAAADRAELDATEIIREIRRLALSDIAGIVGPDGKLLLPHQLDAATRAAVASFKIDEYGRIEYKFWDKKGALDMAAKIKGLYEIDNKQKADALTGLLDSLKGNVMTPAPGAALPQLGEEEGD